MKTYRPKFFFASALALISIQFAGCQTAPKTPKIISAERLGWQAPPTVRIENLIPGQGYTLELERESAWSADATERSRIKYSADDKGRIDTSLQPRDVDALIRPYLPFQKMIYKETLSDVQTGRLRIRLLGENDAVISEREILIGADKTEFDETPLGPAFPGAFVLRKKGRNSPAPAIVILGGSEGGDGSARAQAPTFAAEGYTVLGFPYYSPAWFGNKAKIPELPRAFAELPIDYLEKAIAELRKRSDVDADRIILLGGSKGAEYVLLAGALIDDASEGGGFCAIIADVPSDVVWEGWGHGEGAGTISGFSWKGKALPFVPYVDMRRALNARQAGDDYTMTDAHENGRRAFPQRVAAARIAVETIDEPILVIGADKDTTWASGAMARTIVQSRNKAGRVTEAYIYPNATHAAGGNPLTRTEEANLRARLENFPAMMTFIKANAKRKDCRGTSRG